MLMQGRAAEAAGEGLQGALALGIVLGFGMIYGLLSSQSTDCVDAAIGIRVLEGIQSPAELQRSGGEMILLWGR
jgi:hypothetical protein